MHEISQLDIPNRQELTANLEPRVSFSKEIGEATMTHTIFGRARFVSPANTTTFAVNCGGRCWWRWRLQPGRHGSHSSPPSRCRAQTRCLRWTNKEHQTRMAPEHVPAPPETIATPAAVPLAESKPAIPASTGAQQTGNHPEERATTCAKLGSYRPNTRQANGRAQAVLAVRPQSAPLAASSVSALNQPGKPLPAKPLPTSQPVAPAAGAAACSLACRKQPGGGSAACLADSGNHANPGASGRATTGRNQVPLGNPTWPPTIRCCTDRLN